MRRTLRGFTLIELLVVVAIIALLISILVPALKAARREGKRIKCAANVRELLVAVRVYANEEKDFMPITNWGWPRNNNNENLPKGWLYDPDELEYRGSLPQWKQKDVETGALFTTARQPALFRCPEHSLIGRYEHDTRQLTSYLMNGSMGAFSRHRSFDTPRYRIDAVVFWEPPDPEGMDERSSGFFDEDWQDGSSTPDQGFSFRHGRSNGATMGIIDGHVEWWSLSKYTEKWRENRYPNALWCNPQSRNGH